MATALAEFKKGKSDFDKAIAKEVKANKASSAAVDAAKDFKAVEKAATEFDKALAAHDAAKMRAASADLTNSGKAYRGKLGAANIKLQKLGLDDAAGVVASLSAAIFSLEGIVKHRADSAGASAGEKLPATTFLGDWKAAKKMFEAITGKKKPSASFLGAFRKSSGLEKAIGNLDVASKKNDLEAFKTAFAAFDREADTYLGLCRKAAGVAVAKDDHKIDDEAMEASDYKTSLENLLKGLNGIRHEAKSIVDA